MADFTGPTSKLPGSHHYLPPGTMCDEHPDRPAIARIQGETDSFGSELIDVCAECLAEIRAATKAARTGKCDWCKSESEDLRDHRDYEEGSCGPVYRVCGSCREREQEYLEAYLDDFSY